MVSDFISIIEANRSTAAMLLLAVAGVSLLKPQWLQAAVLRIRKVLAGKGGDQSSPDRTDGSEPEDAVPPSPPAGVAAWAMWIRDKYPDAPDHLVLVWLETESCAEKIRGHYIAHLQDELADKQAEVEELREAKQ